MFACRFIRLPVLLDYILVLTEILTARLCDIWILKIFTITHTTAKSSSKKHKTVSGCLIIINEMTKEATFYTIFPQNLDASKENTPATKPFLLQKQSPP